MNEKINIQLELDSTWFKKDLTQAETFARDTWKKLDPLLTKKLELEFWEAKVQLREVQESVKKTRKEFDAGLISRKQLRDAEAGLKNVSSATTEAGRRLQNYRNTGDPALSRIQDKVNQLNWGFWKMKWFLLWVGSAIISAFSVRKIQEFSDTFQSMQNQIAQIAEWDDIDKIQNKLFNLANEARVPIDSLTSSFVRFELVNKNIWGTTEETFKIIDTLSKWLINAGSSASEASSVMTQLAQAFGSWRLAGDEFRSVSENLPIILDILAKKLGVPRGALKDLAAEWVITSQVLKEALIEANSDIDDAFNKTSATIWQTLTQATNRFLKKFGELDETYWITEKITKLINTLADAIIWVIEFTAKWWGALKDLALIITSLVSASALLWFIRILRLLPAALSATTVATYALSAANTVLAATLARLWVASVAALWPLAALAAWIYAVIYAYRELAEVQDINSTAEKNRNNVTGQIADNITESARAIQSLRKENEKLAKSSTQEAKEQIKLNKNKLAVETQNLKTQELLLERQRLNNQERYDEADALNSTISANIKKTQELRKQFWLEKQINDLGEKDVSLKIDEVDTEWLDIPDFSWWTWASWTIKDINEIALEQLQNRVNAEENILKQLAKEEIKRINESEKNQIDKAKAIIKVNEDLAKNIRFFTAQIMQDEEDLAKLTLEQEDIKNDKRKENLEELEDQYDILSDTLKDNLDESKDAIDEFNDKIKDTQDEIAKLWEDSSDSAKDITKNFGGAESDLRKTFERLAKDVWGSLESFSGTEVFASNVDWRGRDIDAQDIRDFIEAKKEQLEIEKEINLAENNLEELLKSKSEEEKIYDNFTQAKISLEENYKNIKLSIEQEITDDIYQQGLQRNAILEKTRLKAIETAKALRDANMLSSSSSSWSTNNVNNSKSTSIWTINVTDNTAVQSLERTLNTNIQ